MAPKNPIGRLADNAVKAIKDPRKTAEKVVEQAKGTAARGRMVAEHVGRTAASKAGQTAGAVVGRAPGRKPSTKRTSDAPRAESSAPLRPVPPVNEAGHTPEENRAPAPAAKAPAKQATPSPADVAGLVEAAVASDPNTTGARPVKKAAARKAPVKKAVKAPAKKSAPGDKLPIKKAADKAPAKKVADSPEATQARPEATE